MLTLEWGNGKLIKGTIIPGSNGTLKVLFNGKSTAFDATVGTAIQLIP